MTVKQVIVHIEHSELSEKENKDWFENWGDKPHILFIRPGKDGDLFFIYTDSSCNLHEVLDALRPRQ
jgi:hypothetical protein